MGLRSFLAGIFDHVGEDGRRTMVIILNAAPGYVRPLRGLVGKTIRDTFGVARWNEPPYHVDYLSFDRGKDDHRAAPGMTRQYTIDVTDAEGQTLAKNLNVALAADGWSENPLDIYHD